MSRKQEGRTQTDSVRASSLAAGPPPQAEDCDDRRYREEVTVKRAVFEEILSPFEGWLMTTQSLLVWESPHKSAVLFVSVNALFWIVSSMSNHILALISWGLMMLYIIFLWKTKIWPTIRVPSPITDQEDWVPMHANLLSVPELSQHLAEISVTSKLYLQALYNLRNNRKTAFLALTWSACAMMFILGHYLSGFTISYICVIFTLLWPCAVYHKILPRLYMVIEPHLMALQYNLMSRLKTKKTHKKRRDQRGDTVETDSEDDDRPAINPELSAAIARTITDSEDENGSGGSPLSVTREPSLGYNSDLDNLEEESPMPDYQHDDQHAISSLEPDVSMMPDFENVCEDSNAFLLDTDVMPGMDDVDRSRFTASLLPEAADTDSDTESLPYDALPQPTHQVTASGISQPAAASLTQSMQQVLPGMFAALGGLMKPSQSGDELRLDPRDRIADASVVEDEDSDLDFELVSKDDISDFNNL